VCRSRLYETRHTHHIQYTPAQHMHHRVTRHLNHGLTHTDDLAPPTPLMSHHHPAFDMSLCASTCTVLWPSVAAVPARRTCPAPLVPPAPHQHVSLRQIHAPSHVVTHSPARWSIGTTLGKLRRNRCATAVGLEAVAARATERSSSYACDGAEPTHADEARSRIAGSMWTRGGGRPRAAGGGGGGGGGSSSSGGGGGGSAGGEVS
jgi:uncharacterized membrane protein YgcG